MEFKLIPKKDLKNFLEIQKQYLEKHTLDSVKKDYPKIKII